MGCSSSFPTSPSVTHQVLKTAQVTIGKNIQIRSQKAKIFFLFGGPGSCKGRIVHDIISVFRFKLISAEELLIKSLPRKLANVVSLDDINDIMQIIRTEPKHITLSWVFSLIIREIESLLTSSDCFLVDVIPNMRFLLRHQEFVKDCRQEMEEFEKQWPIVCGISLNITQNAIKTRDNRAKGATSVALSQSDEADMSKTQRRLALYQGCVKNFVNYFKSTERLITFDVSGKDQEATWNQVSNFFTKNLDFDPMKHSYIVMFFCFSIDDLRILNNTSSDSNVDVVKFSDVINADSMQIDQQLKNLYHHILQRALHRRYFIVDLTDSTIKSSGMNEFPGSAIMFIDSLKEFSKDNIIERRNGMSNMDLTNFKAFYLTNNEILFFPRAIDSEACRRIALCMKK